MPAFTPVELLIVLPSTTPLLSYYYYDMCIPCGVLNHVSVDQMYVRLSMHARGVVAGKHYSVGYFTI